MGALSRRKGASFEREIVKRLQAVFPDAHRTAPMQAGHAKLYADLGGVPGFHVECGHGKTMNAANKWQQAMNDLIAQVAGSGQGFQDVPIAVTKRDKGSILVTMSLTAFLDLVGKATSRTPP